MADNDTVHIGENSPEYVAYRLMQLIADTENNIKRDRKWILDTYAECLLTVHAPGNRLQPHGPS
jgi:hypothetical protein